MAREYARVKVSIWADADFRLLSTDAQHLYFVLLSSPTMTLCGVADWRPNRLSALTGSKSAEDVRSAAKELVERGYIVTDEDTEEVLVRSFVRHDGLIKTPNIAAAMRKDYAGVASANLRGVIVHELRRLHDDDPGMKGWATASELLSDPSINPSDMASPNPSAMPSGKASVTALPMPSGNESHIPQPSSVNQQPSARASRRSPQRPLPSDWHPKDSHRAKADELGVDMDREAEKFRLRSESTDARYADWDKAFTNWLIKADEFRPKRPEQQPVDRYLDEIPEAWR